MGLSDSRSAGMAALLSVALMLPAIALPAGAAPAPRKAAAQPTLVNKALPAVIRITMQTSEGIVVIDLNREKAPLTTANFLKYVDTRRYDGTQFFRAMKYGAQEAGRAGLVQGRARWDGRKIIPPVKHEATTLTGLKHSDGAISMARGAIDSATSDFFIVLGAMPALDADPKQAGDNQGFAVFGQVVDGLDVVRKIHAAAISPTLGEGVMKGQILAAPVKIITTRRVPLPVAAKPQ